MAATSVTDARTVVIVERLLMNGYAIRSRLERESFAVTIAGRCDEACTGLGDTFPEALYEALKVLPRVALR